jgi:hypothetical protein
MDIREITHVSSCDKFRSDGNACTCPLFAVTDAKGLGYGAYFNRDDAEAAADKIGGDVREWFAPKLRAQMWLLGAKASDDDIMDEAPDTGERPDWDFPGKR